MDNTNASLGSLAIDATKGFLQSKTVLAAGTAAIAGLVSAHTGLNISSDTQTEILNAAPGIITTIASLFAIWGRITATAKVSIAAPIK